MSTDGGSVWTEIDSYFDNGAALALDPFDQSTLWAGGAVLDSTGTSYIFSVVKTTDAGATWSRYDIGTEEGTLYTLAINPMNTDMVYAGGHESGNSVIYRTDDGGTNWSKLTVSGLTGYVYDLVVDAFVPRIVFAATYSGIFVSNDFGDSWTQCDPGLGGTRDLLLTYPTDDLPTIYAGTENSGVWYSTDGGNSWYEMNSGLDDNHVGRLAIDDGSWLVAGTDSYAAYRWNILTEIAENTSTPFGTSGLSLSPNPGSGSILVNYCLSAPAEIEIAVYDLQGRLVSTVYNGLGESGSHSVLWETIDDNGSRLATGVYFCHLRTDMYSESEKLLLIGVE